MFFEDANEVFEINPDKKIKRLQDTIKQHERLIRNLQEQVENFTKSAAVTVFEALKITNAIDENELLMPTWGTQGYTVRYHLGPPRSLHLIMPGYVPSLNVVLKTGRVIDQKVYYSAREWWHYKVRTALSKWNPRTCEGPLTPFEQAVVLIRARFKHDRPRDTDNYLHKHLLDALMKNQVVPDDDSKVVVACVVMAPANSESDGIEVVVIDGTANERLEDLYAWATKTSPRTCQ